MWSKCVLLDDLFIIANILLQVPIAHCISLCVLLLQACMSDSRLAAELSVQQAVAHTVWEEGIMFWGYSYNGKVVQAKQKHMHRPYRSSTIISLINVPLLSLFLTVLTLQAWVS